MEEDNVVGGGSDERIRQETVNQRNNTNKKEGASSSEHLLTRREARIDTSHLTYQCNFVDSTSSSSRSDNLTVVTAFWDLKHYNRSSEQYMDWLVATLDLKASFVVIGNEDVMRQVLNRTRGTAAHICTISLELEQHDYYQRFYESNRRVLGSLYFQERIQDYGKRIETINPLYNIVMMAKFGNLEMVRQVNPFDSQYFIWVDAGLSRFWPFKMKRRVRAKVWPSSALMDVQRVFGDSHRLVVPMAFGHTATSMWQATCIARPNNNDFGMWSSDSHLCGGILGASKDAISNIDFRVKQFLQQTLSRNQSANDQILMLALMCQEPSLFRLVYSSKFYQGQKQLSTHLALTEENVLHYVDPSFWNNTNNNGSSVVVFDMYNESTARYYASRYNQPFP